MRTIYMHPGMEINWEPTMLFMEQQTNKPKEDKPKIDKEKMKELEQAKQKALKDKQTVKKNAQ